MRRWFLLLSATQLFIGCGRSPVAKVNTYDPAVATTKAIEIYDRNGDSRLSADEVKASHPLVFSQKRIDADRDGALTADEIRARFSALVDQADLILLEVNVTSKGKPLAGATVTLLPESFMGDAQQSYSGTTTAAGGCVLKGTDFETLGIPIGFYEVRVVHPEQAIDAVRGVEIADDTTGSRLEIAL